MVVIVIRESIVSAIVQRNALTCPTYYLDDLPGPKINRYYRVYDKHRYTRIAYFYDRRIHHLRT